MLLLSKIKNIYKLFFYCASTIALLISPLTLFSGLNNYNAYADQIICAGTGNQDNYAHTSNSSDTHGFISATSKVHCSGPVGVGYKVTLIVKIYDSKGTLMGSEKDEFYSVDGYVDGSVKALSTKKYDQLTEEEKKEKYHTEVTVQIDAPGVSTITRKNTPEQYIKPPKPLKPNNGNLKK